MAIYDPKDTLAYHMSRVLAAHRDMSDVPCKAVAKQALAFAGGTNKHTHPETDALAFYAMNHLVALVSARYDKFEPLKPDDLYLVTRYHAEMPARAQRAFFYLLYICTREFRHCQNFGSVSNKITAKYGDSLGSWFASCGHGEDGILQSFLHKSPNASISAYCEALSLGFYQGSWGGGFGGKAWGQVTDCMVRFVRGEFSAEMMLDTVWTLCHNNGPIFNKGHFYQCYGPHLVRILDVQRSGQIPQMVLSNELSPYCDAVTTEVVNAGRKRFPAEIGTYVDWFTVEALGSVHKYPSEKQQQAKKYGVPEHYKELAAMEAKKQAELQQKKLEIAQKQAEAKAKADAEHILAMKHKFEYMKDHYVDKITRDKIAA